MNYERVERYRIAKHITPANRKMASSLIVSRFSFRTVGQHARHLTEGQAPTLA